MRIIPLIIGLILVTSLTLLPLACTPSPHHSRLEPHSQPWASLKSEEVSQFTLSSQHTENNENWLIEFTKENQTWVMSSQIGLPPMLDFFAHDNYIQHLLDALSSTRLKEPAPRGPLGAFHLDPPRYALKINVKNYPSRLLLGDSVSSTPFNAFAIIEDSTPWVISSPLLHLFKSLTHWKQFRIPNITFESPDDIDEIKLLVQKKLRFYAQRDGEAWANASHQKIHAPIELFLKRLLIDPPLALIEDQSQLVTLKNFIQTHPHRLQTIELSGGFIQPIQLLVFTDPQGRTLLHYSRRPRVYFQIQSGILERMI